MDVTVLPNNNHPEQYLQLDVGMLPDTHGMSQLGAALSGQRQWQNRMYSQKEKWLKGAEGQCPALASLEFKDRELEQHITPLTLKPKIKQNPLYLDIRTLDAEENQRSRPSWTIQDYDRHSVNAKLGEYLQAQGHRIRKISTNIISLRNILIEPDRAAVYLAPHTPDI